MMEAHYDEAVAKSFLDKHVLVGITYIDALGEAVERKQFHGRIVRIDPFEGVVVRMEDGDVFSLPPRLGSFKPAEPGEYELRSTGEVIINPDFISTWRLRKAVGH